MGRGPGGPGQFGNKFMGQGGPGGYQHSQLGNKDKFYTVKQGGKRFKPNTPQQPMH
jgi:hypothetical protein